MSGIVGLVLLVVATGLLIWLGTWVWRVKNGYLKWGGVGLSTLTATAFAFLSMLAAAGIYRMHARHAPIPDIEVAAMPGQIRRGQIIVESFCDGCHSMTEPLVGDFAFTRYFPIFLGSFASPNLTPAGRLSRWSDGELFRAIRNAIDADGNWLMMMSYTSAGKLSDSDINAVIAYLRRQPAAGHATEKAPDKLNLLGIIMLGAGMLAVGAPVSTDAVTAPQAGPTRKYGEYIVMYQDCRRCHGSELTGAPSGPDLNLVKKWSLPEFIATMRTGLDPNGHELNEEMPWASIAKIDDEQLGAIYAYLKDLPELKAGNE